VAGDATPYGKALYPFGPGVRIQAFFYPGGKRILVIPGTFDLFGAELSMPSWLEGVGLVSVGGMTFGLYLVLRLGIIVMMSIYFNRSTSPPHFIAGLSRMGIPHSIGLGVNIALRFIPQMTREMEDMKMAQRARGRKFSEGNVFRRVINLLALLRPMVIRYIIRTRHLSNVLNARCYFPGVKRSSFHRIRMNTFDWALLISLVSLVAMASVYRFI